MEDFDQNTENKSFYRNVDGEEETVLALSIFRITQTNQGKYRTTAGGIISGKEKENHEGHQYNEYWAAIYGLGKMMLANAGVFIDVGCGELLDENPADFAKFMPAHVEGVARAMEDIGDDTIAAAYSRIGKRCHGARGILEEAHPEAWAVVQNIIDEETTRLNDKAVG